VVARWFQRIAPFSDEPRLLEKRYGYESASRMPKQEARKINEFRVARQ